MAMSVRREDIEDIYELTPLQQVMLFHSLYAPGSGVYVEQMSFPLPASISAPLLFRAWQRMVDLHGVFRTSFHWEGLSKPVQVVRRAARLEGVELDWSGLPEGERERRMKEYLDADRRAVFDLERAPLMRLALLRLSNYHAMAVWTFHHALLDGWSVQLIGRRVAACYETLARGGEYRADPGPSFGEYIAWIQRHDDAATERYWRRVLAGFAAPTPLGIDVRRASAADALGSDGPTDWFAEMEHRISAGATAALNDYARRSELTLNTLVQGAWAILLSRYAGETDVLFGAIVSGRPAGLAGVESMVGLLINTLPVRIHVDEEESVERWLAGVQVQQAESRRYEHSHLVQVQGWSAVPRGTPMFESVLVFENFPMSSPVGMESSDHPTRLVERTNLPLTLLIVPGREILLKAIYHRGRLEAAAVHRMLQHLETVLSAMGGGSHRFVADLPIMPEAERRRLLVDVNETAVQWSDERSIARMLHDRSRSDPESVAFTAGDRSLTLGELDRRSNRLARFLQGVGVAPGARVALCVERSFDAAVALVAILKIDAVYVPLDPSYPDRRLRFMLQDSAAAALVTTAPLAARFPEYAGALVRLDADNAGIGGLDDGPLPHVPAPALGSTAYILYTSGSTGRPKGVQGTHGQILNRLHWMWRDYPFEDGEVSCQKTALSFIDSLWEILGPLLQGSPCVIVPDEVVRDPDRLVGVLAEHRVTRLWLVPSLLRYLLESVPDMSDRLPALRFWVSSGEELTPDLVQRFRERFPHATLCNLYGTSEIWDATWHDPSRLQDPERIGPVSIGRPITNVRTYVLDGRRRPTPLGVSGELYVGGAAVGPGYLNLPELTDERFVPDPFSPNGPARLYKTGDRVRILDRGDLHFLGRLDRQVKVRGHRIEPSEVEAALCAHPSVREAAVVVHEASGGPRLVAYLAFRQKPAADALALRAFIRESLPEFMIPSFLIEVPDLPRTPSGKLDRRALPPPMDPVPFTTGAAAPHWRTPTQEAVAKVFIEILGVGEIGPADDFFADLGGHSLQATQAVSRVREALHVDLPLRSFFESPTVARLAERVDHLLAQGGTASASIPRVSRERYRSGREPAALRPAPPAPPSGAPPGGTESPS